MPRSDRTASHSPKATPAPVVKLPSQLTDEAEGWVTSTLKKMTLEEKLGQLLMVECFGGFASTESLEVQEWVRQVEHNHVGGFVIGTRAGALGIARSRAYATAALTNFLQSRAQIPLLVGADFERGTAMRLEEGTSFPHAMAVAATGRTADAYTVGRITAVEARATGVHWIFAPVADVNSDPENPIINTRSFGEDAERVAAFVASYVRGVEDHGAFATAKHFPGHGSTKTDSHLDLPTVPSDRPHLERVELRPFRAAITAGVGAIMPGHIAVPALERDLQAPATMSSAMVTDLLRREMEFHGVVITDALNMGAIAGRFGPAEAAVRAILAGADVLLMPPEPDAALAGLRAAVRNGRLPFERIDEAVTRVLRCKVRLGLHKEYRVNLDTLAETVGRPEFGGAALDIADRGITLLRDTPNVLPLDATRPTRALLIAVAGDADPNPGQDFENEIRWRVDTLDTLRCDTKFKTVSSLRLPQLGDYDVTILALFIRVADRKGSVGLPEEQVEVARKILVAAKDKHVIVACFGNPYVMARFPDAKTWLAAFSTADVAQRALGRALFGEVAVDGRCPVNVPGAIAVGLGGSLHVAADPMILQPARPAKTALFTEAFQLLNSAVADRAFPGGVVGIGYRGELTLRPFGAYTYEVEGNAGPMAVTAETIYDAASLSKAVVTTTLTGMLVETGQLDLDAPIARYVPEWSASPEESRSRVTIRHLLTHTSGLPAHQKYFLRFKTHRELIAATLREPLVEEPGKKAVYSDVGFLIVGEIIERLTGRGLAELARERIFFPLGMSDSMFNPPASLRPRIAPTEYDSTFRQRWIHGEVHDENAWAMDGVAGHAGMFSTARDLAVFCQMLLNGGVYAHRRLLKRSTIAEFTSPAAIAGHTHTLGWMVPTADSSSGRYFSASSFGHLGYTGTSIWIDPRKELFVVLLTNRVHPTRKNDKIKLVRPALHDAIAQALESATADPTQAPRRSR